ncbi:MAG TPA: hypothetical protein VFV38_31660 [Ktedonobacteraceae bacterium]|nr:hypothetical protein [Ktedonobacteraceae bacterium]
MLRFYIHTALQQVYILLQLTTNLQWHITYPNGTPTRYPNLHMYARQAPDAGHPESECGLVPVHEAMFIAYMEEIPYQKAAQLDPQLAQYAQRIAEYPSLPQVLGQFPRWSKLFLMECDYTSRSHLFDVYRVEGPEEKMICFTPLLAQLLASEEYEGRQLLLVPLRRTYQEAGDWLVQAIAERLWGSQEHAPAYAYAVEC